MTKSNSGTTHLPQNGEIWRIDPTQPLDGKTALPHFCVVIDTSNFQIASTIAVVGITSTTLIKNPDPDEDRVSLRYGLQSGTGLHRKCHALPRWLFNAKLADFDYLKGMVSNKELAMIRRAVLVRKASQSKTEEPH